MDKSSRITTADFEIRPVLCFPQKWDEHWSAKQCSVCSGEVLKSSIY